MNTSSSECSPGKKVWQAPAWNRTLAVVACALPMLFVLYSLWPGTKAWWSIIDDHRKMYILQVEHGLPLSAVFRHFWHAIDFPPLGISPRVQPIYHVLWGMELHYFGLNPHAWYALRIACALIFAGTMATAGARLLGTLAAVLLSLAILLPGFYAEVFLRLGTQESYIAPALTTALLIGTLPEARARGWALLSALLYLFVLLVAFGSKEVALVFVPPVALLVWIDFRKSGLRSFRLWSGLLSLAFAMFVLTFLWLGLRGQKVDLYGRDLSLVTRLLVLLRSDYMRGIHSVALVIAILAPGAAWLIGCRVKRVSELVPILFAVAINELIILTAYVGTLIFYNMDVPVGSHYEFPTYPLQQLLVFFGGAASVLLLIGWTPVRHSKAISFAVAAIVVLMLQFQRQPQWRQLRLNAENVQARTSTFERNFGKLLTEAKANSRRPIEFVSHGFNDFEPVNSLMRFLRGYGATNSIILNVAPLANVKVSSPWEEYLRGLMTGIRPAPGQFSQVSTGPLIEGSIRVFFSDQQLTDGAVANFWPML